MGGRALRSEVLSIRRMSDNLERRRTAGRTQSSEEGAKEPAGHRVDKRAPSNQKMYLLPTIHEGAEWPGLEPAAAECPGGGISSDCGSA